MSKQITILDPGLRSNGEHSYNIVRGLAAEFTRRGIPYEVYGYSGMQKEVEVEIGCYPHFSHYVYDDFGELTIKQEIFNAVSEALAVGSRGHNEYKSRLLNACFYDDLKRLPAYVWRSGSIVLIPTITKNQILGLAQFLRSAPWTCRSNVFCQIMFAPTWAPGTVVDGGGENIYRKALRKLQKISGLYTVFIFENDNIANLYARLFSIETHVVPIPLVGAKTSRSSHDGEIRIGFFGYSKSEKGFHLLPEAVRLCQAHHVQASFVVQVQHHDEDDRVVNAVAELSVLRDVTLLHGPLTADDYARQTSQVDIILLPYDPVRFGLRGSGIFVESVTAGRPIIAAAGTWAAQNIGAEQAAGVVFEPYDSKSLADAILYCCNDLGRFRESALQIASRRAVSHSVNAYVDSLLDLAPCRA